MVFCFFSSVGWKTGRRSLALSLRAAARRQTRKPPVHLYASDLLLLRRPVNRCRCQPVPIASLQRSDLRAWSDGPETNIGLEG